MRAFRIVALCVMLVGGMAGALAALGANGVNGGKNGTETDPYLWLEDVHGPRALAWVKEQNAHSESLLKADPRYRPTYDAILKVLDADDRIPYGALRGNYVFNFWQDADHPKGIWRRTTIADYALAKPNWETLLDLDRLAKDEKENWVWKGADCAPTLSRCLITLSKGGGDAHVVREFDLKTKSFPKDGFALPEAKSAVTYIDDNMVLFGTDFGQGSMTTSGYPRIVKLWKRGESIAGAKTVYEGKADDVASSPLAIRNADGDWAFVVRSPSFFESEYFYLKPDMSALKLPLPLSATIQGITQRRLIFTIRKDWTAGGTVYREGSLLAVPLDAFVKTGELPPVSVLYAPGPRASVEQVAAGRDAVYAAIFDNVVGSVHAFAPDANGTWSDVKLDLPAGGSTGIVSANDYGPDVHFTFESFLAPTTLYDYAGRGEPAAIKSLPARFDASGMTTEQFEATSKDGTKIPYFVVRPKDAAGPRPAILYGYGGFEISLTPSYSANVGKLWVGDGGIYVLANIRGGGEFGPAWHDAALKQNRQKAFDDFAAVAADVEGRGLTTPKQLAIMGGSNGGLLVSTVMTEHPELLGAVVCQVPLIDMLRYTHIGAGASWIAEYGDPADPKARAYIEKYSPYQNARKKVHYPPVFFVTATSDDRVTPVHARKMAAKMEAQGHNVLFFENTDGGHAAAADHKQAAEMWALSYVYLKRELSL